MPLNDFASVILMGGQNKRMKGRHKAFLPFGEKTFLDQIISELSPLSPLYLSVNDIQKYSHLPYPLIQDVYAGIGPIGGIYSALQSASESILFITACDMPFVNAELVTYLYSQLDEESSYVILEDKDGHFCPLGGIYRKNILPLLEVNIKEENFRLGALLKKAKGKIIPLKSTPFQEDILLNINTPEAYEALFRKDSFPL